MRPTSPVATLVFIAGLGIGYFVRSAAGVFRRRTHPDLAAIEKAHPEDIEATLTPDPKRLTDEWAEDGVLLTPGSPPVFGMQAIAAENEKIPRPVPEPQGVELHAQIQNTSSRERLCMRVVRKQSRVYVVSRASVEQLAS